MKRNLKPPSRHPAAGTWSCAPQFMAKYDNREDQRISQTHRTATHDAPWSFLLTNKEIVCLDFTLTLAQLLLIKTDILAQHFILQLVTHWLLFSHSNDKISRRFNQSSSTFIIYISV